MYFILATILICHSVLQAKMQSFLSQFEIKQIVYEAKTTKGCWLSTCQEIGFENWNLLLQKRILGWIGKIHRSIMNNVDFLHIRMYCNYGWKSQ